uniref:ARAD1C30162p n=1 Tax=Blastobotrys adeninivorans TaxID=409370 RepID=A0A060T7T2_BLAAD
MSFFGLQTVVRDDAEEQTIDFDDSYDDKLGDKLQETNDELNDETFGVDIGTSKDFDFAGQTARVADTLDEEQFAFARTSKPAGPSGLGPQQQQPPLPENVPSLTPIPSLWGASGPAPQTSAPAPASQPAPAQPRALTLEEVEAEMLRKRSQQPPPPHPQQYGMPAFGYGMPPPPPGYPVPPPDPAIVQQHPGVQYMGFPPQVGQVPQQVPHQQVPHQVPQQVPLQAQQAQQGPPGIPPQAQQAQQQQPAEGQPSDGDGQQPGNKPYKLHPDHRSGVPSLNQVISEDQAKSQEENERLLEKSRKTAAIVKYNGLMSQWDKNFIMRIQLQQMVTEDPYNEDFYYQVHSAIRARNNPQQPLNAFAKTYLFQRGQRGRFRRDHNPLQKMQQQVQQAVESARKHPKKDQIAPEGALGKISVGSGKRPRQTLNVMRSHQREGSADLQTPSPGGAGDRATPAGIDLSEATRSLPQYQKEGGNYDKKHILKAIEDVYSILLQVESYERTQPPEGTPEFGEWEAKMRTQIDDLWDRLQVTAPTDANNVHPFIVMLSHDKGKKIIPRIFRHIDQKQRLTILTRIIAHIDSLEVVKLGVYVGGVDLKPKVREAIELFSQTVLPPLVRLISESSYDVVVGLFEILLKSPQIVHVASTKIGLAFLTVLISRAELIKQSEEDAPSKASVDDNWEITFNNLFNSIQGHLAGIFPPRNVDDSYVWHFLASLALAAKLDHQRVMVDEVRDKIFGTMAEAKALPVELGSQKIANLNLFLNVMGLNATTTAIGELEN